MFYFVRRKHFFIALKKHVFKISSLISFNPTSPFFLWNTSLKDTARFRSLLQLVQEHGSPLMLIEKHAVREKINLFRSELPFVDFFYAIKANPTSVVLDVMQEEHACYDCASWGEISKMLSRGVSPKDIIFAHTVKRPEDLRRAVEAGVDLMTVDNPVELEKIALHAPGARVLFRLGVEDKESLVKLNEKFGGAPSLAKPLLIKAARLGLIPYGISFHVGSQCTNPAAFVSALSQTLAIADDCQRCGVVLRMIDIGGGFPIQHHQNDTHPLFSDVAAAIRDFVEEHKLTERFRFIAEPGRFMVGESATLVTSVLSKSVRSGQAYYYLDDGVYQDFSGMVFEQAVYEIETFKQGKLHPSTLAGPTCDSFDQMYKGLPLPLLEVGDLVVARNIGAYSCCSSVAAFNGIAPAKIVGLDITIPKGKALAKPVAHTAHKKKKEVREAVAI